MHVSKTWGSAPRLRLLAGARANVDLGPRPGAAVPRRGARVTGSWLVSRPVGHDAVVGSAGADAAGAGAVAAEHLRGGPAVEFHQVSLGSAAVQPGVAEVVPEPVRVGVHAGL